MTGDGPRVAGRDRELARLHTGLKSVSQGRGGVSLLEGEAGHGKSRLLDEALLAAPDGLVVIRGHADPLERHRPFGPLRVTLGLTRYAADPARREVGELLAPTAPEGPGPVQLGHVNDAHFRAVEAVVDLVQDLSTVPTVLVLDDVQWADESTLLVLRQLARRTRYVPLLLVLAYRPSGALGLEQLRVSLIEDGADVLHLGPLEPSDVDRVILDAFGAPPGRSFDEAIRGAAGCPLYIVELVRALQMTDGIEVVEGRGELVEPDLPMAFVETVCRRIDALGNEIGDVLRTAAIAGTDFDPDDLAAVLDRDVIAVLADLEIAIREGILLSKGDRLGFRQDLVRRAVYDSTPAAIRRSRHRLYADRLIAVDAAAEPIAWHLTQSSDPPDAAVATWLAQAARHESTRAPNAAAELLRTALDYLDPGDETRDALQCELAAELVWAGRTAQGSEMAEQLLVARAGHDRLHSVLALAYLLDGRYVDAVTQIELAAARTDIDELTRGQLRAEAAMARFLSGDLDGAEADGAVALEVGQRLGDELSTCVGLCALAWKRNAAGDGAGAVELAEEAVRAAEAASSHALARYSPHLFLGVVYLNQDRVDDAQQTLRHGLSTAESAGTLLNVPSYHACLALADVEMGAWDDAVAECEAGLMACRDLGVDVGSVWLYAVSAYIAIQRDDLAAALDAVNAGEASFLRSGPQFGVDWLMLARGLLTETDDPSVAYAVLGSAWDMYEGLGIQTHRPTIGLDLVRVALAQGDPARARDVAAVLAAASDARSRRLGVHANGLVRDDPDQLLEAVRLLGEAPRPFELGRAQEDAAVALARAGRVDDAKVACDVAAEIYGRLGATRAQAKLRAAQRASGVSRGTRGRRNRPSTGWDSLTDTEHGVVRLVADGLTNRQIGERLFVSRRTVETHVSHVFGKLGVRSRVELARMTLDRSVTPEPSAAVGGRMQP